MIRTVAVNTAFAALLLHALPAWAITCDELRSQVEAKIREAGVAQFTVTVLDAATPSTGRVVGSCDRGNKKLVYQPITATVSNRSAPANPAATPPRKPRQEDPIPTECKDGSISMTGVCKTP